jgi:hypothetical protein
LILGGALWRGRVAPVRAEPVASAANLAPTITNNATENKKGIM